MLYLQKHYWAPLLEAVFTAKMAPTTVKSWSVKTNFCERVVHINEYVHTCIIDECMFVVYELFLICPPTTFNWSKRYWLMSTTEKNAWIEEEISWVKITTGKEYMLVFFPRQQFTVLCSVLFYSDVNILSGRSQIPILMGVILLSFL